MVTPHAVQRHWQNLLKDGVARGALPFSVGASSHYRACRKAWSDRAPVSFREKLQYKLIHDRRPLLRVYADKFAVRQYVSQYAPELKLPRLLALCDEAERAVELIPEERWVMKGTHGANMILVSEPNGPADREAVRNVARDWLATDYSVVYWEWQYHQLPRRILFEEFVGTNEQRWVDYKFFVIHQKVRLIAADQNDCGARSRNSFYPDWTPVRSANGRDLISARIAPRPAKLELMMALAEKLARESDFLRVDLRQTGDDVYFGELTHSPAASDMEFEDPELDREIGDHWILPSSFV